MTDDFIRRGDQNPETSGQDGDIGKGGKKDKSLVKEQVQMMHEQGQQGGD